jgi:formiminoglutamase
MNEFCLNSEIDIQKVTTNRVGELKIGQRLGTDLAKSYTQFEHFLKAHFNAGKRYCILGIPESVGVIANYGKPGAEKAWTAFQKAFYNMQANPSFPTDKVFIAGHFDFTALQNLVGALQVGSAFQATKARNLCTIIDEKVSTVLAQIFGCGLIPIVIGGGHNNAFPILKGYFEAQKLPLNVINIDPHADLRETEGRHSGNPFTYARQAGFLKKYIVYGLEAAYNNERIMRLLMDEADFDHIPFGFQLNHVGHVEHIHSFFDNQISSGLEFDMDSISGFPVSALNPSGFSITEARHIISLFAEKLKPKYLHLCEASPDDSAKSQTLVGKALALLVYAFIQALERASAP